MKPSKFVLLFSAIIMIALLVGGCKNDNSAPTQPLQKSSNLLLKIGNKAANGNILTSTGEITISSFKTSLSKVSIQENSGFDGENKSDNNGGNDNKTKNENNENDASDIVINGPFNLDIASGTAELGNVNVYPGVFKKVDLSFITSSQNPFDNYSIVVNGNYKKQNGELIPFTIRSKFSDIFETLIANGGITVNSNSTVTVIVEFNFNNIFGNMDFSNAVISNGVIKINEQNNTALLQAFEANLNNSIEAKEE